MSQPLVASLFDETERRPMSVSELTAKIRGELERHFTSVRVEASFKFFGHTVKVTYFTLKDEFAQLGSCYQHQPAYSLSSRRRFAGARRGRLACIAKVEYH